MFNVVLIQFVDNRFLSRLQCTRALSFLLLRLVVSHDLLSTEEGFPEILTVQVSVGRYLSNMGGDIFCCYSFFLVFVHLRVGTGPEFYTSTKDYNPQCDPR